MLHCGMGRVAVSQLILINILELFRLDTQKIKCLALGTVVEAHHYPW